MMQPIAGIIAHQMTRGLATSALPSAPVRLDPIDLGEHRMRRLAAHALASAANRLDPSVARAGIDQ
jgi:hypothetical protein